MKMTVVYETTLKEFLETYIIAAHADEGEIFFDGEKAGKEILDKNIKIVMKVDLKKQMDELKAVQEQVNSLTGMVNAFSGKKDSGAAYR